MDAYGGAGRTHVMRGVICALIGAICWGFSGTCSQLLMDVHGAPAGWITSARMLICAAIFLLAAVVKDRDKLMAMLRDWRSVVWILVYAIFGVLLTQISYLNVIKYTSAGVGTTLEQLGMAFTMLYVCCRSRRLPRLPEFVGLVLALLGMLLIATQGDLGRLAIPIEGLVWGLISAVSLSFYTLMPVKVLGKWGSMPVTGLAMFFGGALSASVVHPWNVPFDLTPEALAVFIVIIIVGTFFAYLLYLQGIADAGPVKAGLLCCMEPVSAMVLAAVWLRTDVSVWDVAGCALIVVMVVLVSEREKKPAKPAVEHASLGEATIAPEAPMFFGRAHQLGYYKSRVALREDLARVQALLDVGHETAAALGIDEGANKKYPSPRRLMHSIENGTTHVVENADGQLIAVFAVSFSPDKNYARDEIKGAWLTDSNATPQQYAELHWVAVDYPARRRGVGMFILDRVDEIAREGGVRSVRADVYFENQPMQRLLDKHGYEYCGLVTIRDTLGRAKRRCAYEHLMRERR